MHLTTASPDRFWEMIWEREVEVVAMLCDEDSSAEQSPSNCFLYWPERPSEPQVR